jgi:dinuclear metal center YbgI/SA1388 family protein
MKIAEVIDLLEQLAPPLMQEDYDNSQLICGDANDDVTGALFALDCIELVLDEAIEKGCNLIVAHHPIVFTGLKSLTGETYVERIVIKAIKSNISIYAIHTNLDNVFDGVNQKFAQKLDLINTKILAPTKGQLCKLATFVPTNYLEQVKTALFKSGAGQIGQYDHCSFTVKGTGTFRASKGSNPFVGKLEEDHLEEEIKLEVIFSEHLTSEVIRSLIEAHPYEEVAYDLIRLANTHPQIGSGMIGHLASPMNATDFLNHVAKRMKTQVIRHTELLDRPINRVAICGGSGHFLLSTAIAKRADVFISSDFKYHNFFDADKKIVIMDIGHFESEQFTPELLVEYLRSKNVTFAVLLSEVNTNPVHYFIS